MDINYFKAYLKDLPNELRQVYIMNFMDKVKENKVKPIFS